MTDAGSFWTDGGLRPGDLAHLRADFARPAPHPPAGGPSPPALVILCGLPGTGKSHFARALISRAPSFAWVNSDYCRKLLVSGNPPDCRRSDYRRPDYSRPDYRRPDYSREEHQRVFAAMHALVAELLSAGHPVVFDATNLNEEVRRPLYAAADGAGVAPLLIRFTAARSLARQRLSEREQGSAEATHSDAGWAVYQRMADADAPAPRPHLLVARPEHLEWALRETLRRTRLG